MARVRLRSLPRRSPRNQAQRAARTRGAPATVTRNPDRNKPMFALLGDSITLGCTPTSNGQINRGYWPWAQAYSGYRAHIGAYAGVGGNITTQMRARIQADVIDPLTAAAGVRPMYCVLMGGVNDATNTSDIIATATGNLAYMYGLLRAANITPIAMTITPTSSCTTPTQIANWNGINTWLRSYCPANGITLCDNIAACLDQAFPATTSPIWWSGGTHDGVHPTCAGAQAIAQALAMTLTALLPPVQHFGLATAAQPDSITTNPALTGTGGVNGAGTSGAVAAGWRISGTGAVGAKVARSDGIAGEWQSLAIGAASVAFNHGASVDIATGFAVGDTIVAQMEIEPVADWVDITQLVLALECRHDSTVLLGLSCLGNDPYTTSVAQPSASLLTLRTIPTVIPDTTNILRFYLNFTGTSGTVKVGRFELLRLT